MKIITSIPHLKRALTTAKTGNRRVGFVPTMGALHKGHLSLINYSKKESDITVVSIFVNPVQFGPKEDFNQYPRPKKNDILLARQAGVDIIFYPTEKSMYPSGYRTYVEVQELSEKLCGKRRVRHFRGVTTIVAKLIHIVEPDRIYLGQKDAQQAVIIKKMIEDLNMAVETKICATIREKDGLAVSSRNAFLTENQRREAPVLYSALKSAKRMAAQGNTKPYILVHAIRNMILSQTSAKIEYIECVNPHTLDPVKSVDKPALLLLAAHFGKTRLIDNIAVNLS